MDCIFIGTVDLPSLRQLFGHTSQEVANTQGEPALARVCSHTTSFLSLSSTGHAERIKNMEGGYLQWVLPRYVPKRMRCAHQSSYRGLFRLVRVKD